MAILRETYLGQTNVFVSVWIGGKCSKFSIILEEHKFTTKIGQVVPSSKFNLAELPHRMKLVIHAIEFVSE